jgi:hypothetical protein
MIRRRYAQFKGTMKAVNLAALDVPYLTQAFLRSEYDRLKADLRYSDTKHLIPYGRKAYSQFDEDGIIAEIFRRIGTTNKSFVEFGVGNGLENNTLALLFDDWRGLWIDAAPHSIQSIRTSFSKIIDSGRLKVVESFITRENINELIRHHVEQHDIDLLSVDIDGNDYHVLSAITCIRPRVIVIEYNAKFFPPLLYCMEYNASHVWRADDCFGASLKFLEAKLLERGYCLVGCGLSGANAFFVRQDLVADRFLAPFTAESHYQPARYYLNCLSSGHPAAYNTLARSLDVAASRSNPSLPGRPPSAPSRNIRE